MVLPDSPAPPPPLTIRHACCTRPAEWPVGTRVLAMRKPHGFWLKAVREVGGIWLPDAGPSADLLWDYRAGTLDWAAFADRYRHEMEVERPAVLDQLLGYAAADPLRTLIVLCWERLDAHHPHCHRTILVELLCARAQAQGQAIRSPPGTPGDDPPRLGSPQEAPLLSRPLGTRRAGTFRTPQEVYGSMPLPGAQRSPDDAPPPSPPAPEPCAICGGVGYLRQEFPASHPDFGTLMTCECRNRAKRRQSQDELYELSNLGAYRRFTFETFHPLPEVAAALAAAQAFAAQLQGWLILCGGYGCGKTHLAASIANTALHECVQTCFAVVPDLLDHLRATFAPTSDITYDERFEQVREAELLILDDLGAENATPWVREKLYQIINHRWITQRPTVITTNVPFTQMDPRIVSRLRDQDLCRVIRIEAIDYRQRDRVGEEGDGPRTISLAAPSPASRSGAGATPDAPNLNRRPPATASRPGRPIGQT